MNNYHEHYPKAQWSEDSRQLNTNAWYDEVLDCTDGDGGPDADCCSFTHACGVLDIRGWRVEVRVRQDGDWEGAVIMFTRQKGELIGSMASDEQEASKQQSAYLIKTASPYSLDPHPFSYLTQLRFTHPPPYSLEPTHSRRRTLRQRYRKRE